MGEAMKVEHPAWGVRVRPDGAKWLVWWRSPLAPDGFDCRIDSLEDDIASFRQFHENSRTWSPFNFGLSVRLLRGDGVIGLSQGLRADIRGDGSVHTTPLDHAGRIAFLMDELGVSESFAAKIPEDEPMTPPPGSATAARIAGRG